MHGIRPKNRGGIIVCVEFVAKFSTFVCNEWVKMPRETDIRRPMAPKFQMFVKMAVVQTPRREIFCAWKVEMERQVA